MDGSSTLRGASQRQVFPARKCLFNGIGTPAEFSELDEEEVGGQSIGRRMKRPVSIYQMLKLSSAG